MAIKRVLIVEDEPDVRQIINETLKNVSAPFDITIDEREDGLKGLEAIHAQKYDLIIADLEMPRMKGAQMYQHIREDENPNQQTSIIIYSAFLGDLKLETDDRVYLLEKPVPLDRLARIATLQLCRDDD